MALKHVKLPNNSVVDINDSRNVVIGDGVNNAVSLTTAQYEALTTKDPNTIYVITDAQAGAGSVVVWGTESASHTIPLTVDGVTKTVALNGYDSGGGGGGTDNVFIATYGTTTYADVSSAVSAGKAIFCKYGSSSYILSQYVGTGNNKHSFVATTGASNSFIDITWYSVDSTNAWSNTTFSAIEDNSIKTSISSSSTNDDIPSALAAYNFVGSLNTTNTTAQTTSASEKLTGTINLHKVAKTGNYNDLLNKPTIPSISGCVSVIGDQTITGNKTIYGRTTYQWASPLWEGKIYRRVNFTEEYLSPWSFIQIIDGQNNDTIIATLQDTLDAKIGIATNVTTSLGNNQDFQFVGSAGYTVIGTGGVSKPTEASFGWISYGQGSGLYNLQQALDAKQNTLVSGTNIKTVNNNSLVGSGNVSIATPGTLNTTATTAQSTSASEALSGSVTLHKIAKTGTFSDLVSKPTTLSGYGITDGQKAITVSTSEPTSGQGSNGDIWIVI